MDGNSEKQHVYPTHEHIEGDRPRRKLSPHGSISNAGSSERTHAHFDDNNTPVFPNRWARIRHRIREPAAEFLGTMILVLFGCAGNAQGTLFNSTSVSSSPAGGWMDVALGWGIGIALGAWISGGVSGGHINPAVTISLATFRGFPWRKVPVYILAQVLGGIVGAAIVYANYFSAINNFEGGRGVRTLATAGIFGAYAAPIVNNASAFFDEFIGTFILMFTVLAATDARTAPHSIVVPIALFFALFGLGIAFGAQTGFAVNPARDFGPRVLTAMAGWGRAVFNFRHQYWLWTGILAPILGALSATLVYDAILYTGEDSIMNRPNKSTREQRTKERGRNRGMSGATMV